VVEKLKLTEVERVEALAAYEEHKAEAIMNYVMPMSLKKWFEMTVSLKAVRMVSEGKAISSNS